MSQGVRRPWDAVDYGEIVRFFPPAPEYFATAWFDDPDTIGRTQLYAPLGAGVTGLPGALLPAALGRGRFPSLVAPHAGRLVEGALLHCGRHSPEH